MKTAGLFRLLKESGVNSYSVKKYSQRVGSIVQNSVHKEKSEILLWETKQSHSNRSENVRQRRSRSENIRQRRSRTGSVQQGRGRSEKARQGRNRAEDVNLIDIQHAGGSSKAVSTDIGRKPENNRNRSEQYIRRRRARRRRAYFYRTLAFVMLISVFVLFSLLIGMVYKFMREKNAQDIIPVTRDPFFSEVKKEGIEKPEITVDLLDVNEYSRPGTELEKIESIFVHYTANPRTSAAQNRSYFANLEQTHERSASAHFIIGYEGEILQCIPLEEQAYAVMTRNEDSVSIECCFLDEDGKFTQETYDSLVHLLAWLMQEYNLDSTDILRHYDCGGKKCPLYYVEHEDAWEILLRDVGEYH